ncbi:Uncharacterized protein FWK35_00009944 [Aphis craccivora]|uniref:Uncharacterized protein n=1 Tax=Aphis craccivora TaxID=307492 RepID=A0A6G0ZKY2_APHCR|nr:Uncharacterized protein FWK35_00009944 [Aphis craccivora]
MASPESQGQKMSVCDLNLCTPTFSYGQLYVAYSQVGKPSSLFVLVPILLTKRGLQSSNPRKSRGPLNGKSPRSSFRPVLI